MSSRRIRTWVGAVAISILAMGCVEETPALFVVQNSVLGADCRPLLQSSTNEALASGTLDLTVARLYLMFPKVENLMAPSGSVPVSALPLTGSIIS